jgi:hypothetical protein
MRRQQLGLAYAKLRRQITLAHPGVLDPCPPDLMRARLHALVHWL